MPQPSALQTPLWDATLLRQRILAAMDLDGHSPTLGCCDRRHWAWKFTDYPDLSLQYAAHGLALTLDPDDAMHRRALAAVIDFWNNNLSPAGSADQAFPGERSAGPTLYALNGLIQAVELRGDLLPAELVAAFRVGVARSMAFCRREPEDYGFIANHKALYAHTYLRAARLLDDPALREAAVTEVEALAADITEGWFHEYDTADPAYQTQTLHHLLACAGLLEDERPRALAREGFDAFVAHCVFPDGSFAGPFGGRAAETFYPFAAFALADESPAARAAVDLLYRRHAGARLVPWHALDFANAIRLGTNYMLARPLAENVLAGAADNGSEALPCFTPGVRQWPATGLVAFADATKYGIVNTRRGGCYKMVCKATGTVMEDTGAVLVTDRARFTSALYDTATESEITADDEGDGAFLSLRLRAPMRRLVHRRLTSSLLVGLRLAKATLFRWPWAVRHIKRLMVRLLIRRRPAPAYRHERVLSVSVDAVRVVDTIRTPGGEAVRTGRLASPTARLVPFHMASAGYHVPVKRPATLEGDHALGTDAEKPYCVTRVLFPGADPTFPGA